MAVAACHSKAESASDDECRASVPPCRNDDRRKATPALVEAARTEGSGDSVRCSSFRIFDTGRGILECLAAMYVAARHDTIERLYAELTSAARSTEQPEDEDWYAMIQRISVPGQINEITGDVYQYFLFSQPTLLYGGDHFSVSEPGEPLRLFWITDARYFCRQLTLGESDRLCHVVGLPSGDESP
jgi:hypothetical protein